MPQPISLSGKIQVTLFALIFAIAFTAGGVAAGVLPMYKQLSGWWKASSYVPVSARVLSAELETHGGESTTYRTRAEFSYQYQGQSYLSHRINLFEGGHDNVGSYQEDIYRELRQARDNFSQVTLWINPRQPDQAVYDRTIRWKMILFLIPFAVLFPAVGIGAWWVIWRIWRKKVPQDPLSIILEGSQPVISPHSPMMIEGDGGGARGLIFAAAFWNILSWPIAILFFTGTQVAPGWVSALVSIFPVMGLWIIAKAWSTVRIQYRIGKPVLALCEQGVPGLKPLQGEIMFNPALGMRIDTSEMTHAVSVNLECIREDSRGENTSNSTLWHGEVLQIQAVRGTQSLKFRFDLPENLPATMPPGSNLIQDYWQFVLETLGAKVKFKVPVSVVSATGSSVLQQPQVAESIPAGSSKGATRVRWIARTLQVLFIGYFLWVAVFDFAIPFYQSSQKNSRPDPQVGVTRHPVIKAPFVLDAWSGNGFGVVARSAGRMEISDNTVLIYPDSIELRSFVTCESGCPPIASVEFMLSKAGVDNFSVVATGAPIPVQQYFSDAGTLTVNVPADKLPIVLRFTDRQQLAGLRLTLSINGAGTPDGKYSEAYWYTHAEPFANALRL